MPAGACTQPCATGRDAQRWGRGSQAWAAAVGASRRRATLPPFRGKRCWDSCCAQHLCPGWGARPVLRPTAGSAGTRSAAVPVCPPPFSGPATSRHEGPRPARPCSGATGPVLPGEAGMGIDGCGAAWAWVPRCCSRWRSGCAPQGHYACGDSPQVSQQQSPSLAPLCVGE